ncbi:MAG: hypothetical protein M0Q44_01485 [Methylobacter sp.]|jgi:hypothetical protein|nr:hypothetical protein [Methylobacter sp.]
MALKADSQGFLIGEVVSDIRRANEQLTGIRADVKAIKNALLGATSKGSKNANIDGGAKIAAPTSRRDNGTSKVATPAMSKGASVLPPAPKKADTPIGRDASTGKFTKKEKPDDGSNKPAPDDKKAQSIISSLASRITSTAAGAAAGAEEADPAIKAIKEVSEPMMRGYQTLFGGGDKKERWFQKIWKELNLFRKDESVFNKAEAKTLKNIEGKPGGGGGDGDSSGGIMLAIGGLLGRLGPLLLTGITGVLGFIFSPIGLAISAAGAVAWGLFTEEGQKFFGEVGAKIIAGWDKAIDWFVKSSPKTMEMLNKGLDKTNEAIDAVVDSSPKTVAAVKSGVDTAKDLGGKAADAVAKSSPKTTKALSNVWGAAKEGAENISRRAKFNEVEAAKNFQGGEQITGLSDIQTRALAANTSKTESAGKVDADNKQGYFGQYQFGAEALIESGLVKQDKLEEAKKASGKDWYKKRNSQGEMGGHEAFLRDKSNWNTEGGLDAFLQDKGAQDKAFVKYTSKNVAGGIRSGAISSGDSAENIAGYSKAAHLKGVGGANKLFKNGIASTDGNGTSTATYAKQAAAAMTETVDAINAKSGETAPAVASMSDAPTQGGRYKYDKLEGGSAQVTDSQDGTIGLASDEQANAYRRQQGKPYLDSFAAANNPDSYSPGGVFSKSPALHDFVAGPRNNTQTAYAAAPKVPTFSPVSAPAEAPPVKQYLASNSDRNTAASAPIIDVGQDIKDRNIAHIATGGFSGRG